MTPLRSISEETSQPEGSEQDVHEEVNLSPSIAGSADDLDASTLGFSNDEADCDDGLSTSFTEPLHCEISNFIVPLMKR